MRRLALIAPLVLATAAHAGPGLWFVGFPPSGTEAWVQGLTQNGSLAVGVTGTTNGSAAPGFTWTVAGGRYDFGLEPGMPPYTPALGVNTDGSVIVGWKAMASFKELRAYRRVGNGPLEDLGLLPNEARSYAYGVSGDGQIVAGTCEHGQSNSAGQAFRWTPQGGMKGLGFLKSQSIFSNAFGISRDGSTIVGMSQRINFDTDAYRWTESEGMVELPDLPGAPYDETYARAVNADGSVIVGHGYGSDGLVHAVRWVNGAAEDLSPGSGTTAYAYATDDTGNVVAGVYDGFTAFVWTPGTGLMYLGDYLLSFGIVTPADYHLTEVRAVSGDGLTFGGVAFNVVTKRQEGFVATIPSPGGLLVFAAPLFSRRRRG